MFLTPTWKYLYIEDSTGISNHTTKPVERSQNSTDLYPTWYIKYERSASTVGGGWKLSLAHSRHRQNTVISIRQILQRSFECEGCWSKRKAKIHSSAVLPLLLNMRHAALQLHFYNPINHASFCYICSTSWITKIAI